MSRTLKAIVLAVGVFLIVRWYLLVTRAKKKPATAAKEVATIPVQAIGTAAGLASDRSKWDDAKNILVTGIKERRNPIEIYAALVALVESKTAVKQQGNEVARRDTIPRNDDGLIRPNGNGLGDLVGRDDLGDRGAVSRG